MINCFDKAEIKLLTFRLYELCHAFIYCHCDKRIDFFSKYKFF